MIALSGKARLAGVMGWPVAHSRSPRLHGYWLAHHRIDGAYVPMAVRPERIGEALRALPVLSFKGANLTLPHKESALSHVDTPSPTARRIGAVNTIMVGPHGELLGDNTDAFGFIEHMNASAPNWRQAGRPAVVIGAGGAARAVSVALLDAGVTELRLINRTEARAVALAEALGPGLSVVPWHKRHTALEDAGLLVNTTSLGMAGHELLELELNALPRDAVVDDLVYAPLETALLKAARARGHRTVDGLGMLLHQARPGFEAWFGVAPTVTAELRTFVLQDLAG